MVSKEVLSPIMAFPAGLSTPFNIFLTGTEQKKCSSSQERIVYNHSIKKNGNWTVISSSRLLDILDRKIKMGDLSNINAEVLRSLLISHNHQETFFDLSGLCTENISISQ